MKIKKGQTHGQAILGENEGEIPALDTITYYLFGILITLLVFRLFWGMRRR